MIKALIPVMDKQMTRPQRLRLVYEVYREVLNVERQCIECVVVTKCVNVVRHGMKPFVVFPGGFGFMCVCVCVCVM